MKDFHNQLQLARGLSPINVGGNVAQVSQIVDRAGYDGCTWAILTGVLSDADATFTTLLEEGNVANMSDAAPVADDNKQFKLSYKGNKRYLRLTITPANNAAATALTCIAAVAILVSPRTMPKSTQAT